MRVLFLTHRLPYAPDRGDRIRAYHMLRTLVPQAQVDLVSLVHDEREAQQAPALASALGISVTTARVPNLRNKMAGVLALAGPRPLTHVLLDSPALRPAIQRIVDERPPDVVLAYCSGMARVAMQPPLDRFPMVLDMVDVDSVKWSELAERTRGPLRSIYHREARRLAAFERRAIEQANTTLVVNDREAHVLHQMNPTARVSVLPNGVDVVQLAPRSAPAEDQRVVFCGVMNYEPNVEGVLWFAREVWPAVRRHCPTAHFVVVGSDPVPAVRELSKRGDGIEVTGRVKDVPPYLWQSALAVAPLRVARGLQNKVLEAVAAGLPVVVTPAVFDGLPNEVRPSCRIADVPDDFARHVIRLLRTIPAERRALAAASRCASLRWENQMQTLPSIMAQAVASQG